MKNKKILVSLLAMLFMIACRKSTPEIPSPGDDTETGPQHVNMPHIMASGTKLVTEDGKPFHVWGFNWGSQTLMLEAYWNDWNEITGDFKEMADYGAITVRLPLQYNAFMINATTPNGPALQKLKKLVAVAEKNNLYLIVCGLNAFVKEDQPDWYKSMTDEQRWATHVVFWEAVAGAIGESPAILAYDLMNEPVAGANPQNGWLPGNGFGGFFYVQNIALNIGNTPWVDVMDSWIQKMTAAIKKKDNKHLITAGFLPFPVFAEFSSRLSLISTHLYPKSSDMNADKILIQKFISDKPLVISEIFPMNCTDTELQQFIIDQNKNVAGWVWHYNGKTLEELQASGTIPDAVYRMALLKFREMAPTQK